MVIGPISCCALALKSRELIEERKRGEVVRVYFLLRISIDVASYPKGAVCLSQTCRRLLLL